MKQSLRRLLILGLLLAALPLSAAAADESAMQYQILIPPRFEEVKAFAFGLAPVKENGKWGFVNEAGTLLVPAKYDFAYPLFEGKAIVASAVADYPYRQEPGGNYYEIGLIDSNAAYTPFVGANTVYDPISAKWKTITGNIVVDESVFYTKAENGEKSPANLQFFSGLFSLCKHTELGGTQFFGWDGRELENAALSRYEYSAPFHEGVAPAFLRSPLVAPEKFDIIDTNGKLLGSFPSCEAMNFPAGYAFSEILGFNNGVAAAWAAAAQNGSYPAADSYRFALVNTRGKIVFTGNYDRVSTRNNGFGDRMVNDGLIVLRNQKTQLWGAVNSVGKVVVPFQFEALQLFNEGLAPAAQGGKFGFINTAGKMVIAPKYDAASSFSGGYAVVAEGADSYCIDRQGRQIAGSETIDRSVYFPEGLHAYQTLLPDDILVIQEGGKSGFAKMTYTPAPPAPEEVGDWAYAEISRAIAHNLIPVSLQNQYFEKITRADFARLLVAVIEAKSGKDIAALVEEKTGKDSLTLLNTNPFTDSSDPDVLASAALGLTGGTGAGRFSPCATINREQAATLLMRTAQLLGGGKSGSSIHFADDAAISPFARDAVHYVAEKKIMGGTGAGRFSPKGNYTRQQAYVTVCRLFDALQSCPPNQCPS